MKIITSRYLPILILLFIIPTALFAARPTIAVLDFDITKQQVNFGHRFTEIKNIEDTTKFLSSELITFLVKTHKFSVVERDRMKDILTEQEFSESGYISPETAVKIGKLIGADYFVMGKIEQFSAEIENKKVAYTNTVKRQYKGKIVVNVRVVDSRGGKIVSADKLVVELEQKNRKNKLKPVDFLDNLKEKAVRAIVNGIVGGVFPMKVLKMVGNGIYINRGEGADFEVGTILSVVKQGESLIDPDTGEDLGNEEEVIGSVKISEILKKFSKAEVVAGGQDIRKGYLLRVMDEQEQQTVNARELTPGSSDKPFKW